MSLFSNLFSGKNQDTFASQQSRLEQLEKKALEALDRGDSEPAFLLGNTFNDVDDPLYVKNPPYDVCKYNITKAKYWLEKAVDAGHPDAMVVLGAAYCEGGNMVQKNFKYGLELLKKAKSIGTSPPEMADIVINKLFHEKLNSFGIT